MVIPLEEKINEVNQRIKKMKDEKRYFYLKSIDGASGSRVTIDGREMIMFASYNYHFSSSFLVLSFYLI